MTQFDESNSDLSLISSDCTHVCICNGYYTILNYTLIAYPGQTVLINAVAVGQGFGTSPATIHSRLRDSGTAFTPVLDLVSYKHPLKRSEVDKTTSNGSSFHKQGG